MNVVISQSDSRENLIVNGLEMLKNNNLWQFPSDPVLLIIDIPSPIGHPWSLDCGSLLQLIDLLQRNGVDEIYLFPSLHFHFDMNKVIDNLGLTPFLDIKGVHLWNPWNEVEVVKEGGISSTNEQDSASDEDFEEDVDEEVVDFGSIVVYTQIKTMGTDSLWSSLSHLYSINTYYSAFSKTRANNPVNYQGDPSGEILWDWLGNLFNNDNKNESETENEPIDSQLNFPPLLVINDGFQVVDSESQYFWDEAHLQEPGLIFIGTDLKDVEQTTYQYLTINQEKAWFYKNHPHFRGTNPLTPLISSDSDTITPFELNITPRTDPYTIKHFQALPGQLDEGEELQSYLLKPLLRNILFEDFPNHDQMILLMGNAPPDPPIPATIIIYGDNALESTKDARFQFLNTHEIEKEPFDLLGIKIGGTKIVSDDALELEILRKQRKLRQKIDILGQQFEEFKISLGDKDISEERDYLILVKNKKFQLVVQKIRMKIENLRINMQAKNSLLRIKFSEPKLVENTNIIRIPTDRSLGWDFLVDLTYHWKMGKSPSLYNFYRNHKSMYNFPPVPKEWYKSQKENLKIFINSIMQEWSTPLQPELKRKEQEIKEHQKEALLRIKAENNVANSKIFAEYDPPLKELSEKVHQLKKENQILKKQNRKVKIQAFVEKLKRSPTSPSSPISPPEDTNPIDPEEDL
ncbi:MAG: hypothetical protein ACTSYI_12520 [Promethearchaeota archaeon]